MSETTENPIREAIADAIRDHEVILFMKGTPERPACGFSARTVAALDAVGKEFAAVDILPDPRIRQELSALSNWPTIPQLFVKGELVGGCDIVTEMYETGELVRGHGRRAAGRRAGPRAEGRRAGRSAAPDPERPDRPQLALVERAHEALRRGHPPRVLDQLGQLLRVDAVEPRLRPSRAGRRRRARRTSPAPSRRARPAPRAWP